MMASLATPSVQLAPAAGLPAARPVVQTAPASHGIGFALFLVLNATLFVRPGEIVPALIGWEIYQALILLCLLAAFPAILEQLQARSLESRPITVCVLALLLAVVLSHLSHARLEEAALFGWDFFKLVLYFLLFVGLVTTPDRLRTLLRCLIVFAAFTTTLAILQYHGYITLPNLDPIKEGYLDRTAGRDSTVVRLVGSGLFHDPNDLCSLLVVSILLALWALTDPNSGASRLLWLVALGLFLYGLKLTQSRGGLLALLAGLGMFFQARFGISKAIALGALLLPVLLLGGGRQTDLNTTSGTGQDRIQLWSDGLTMFRDSPLFGVGRDEFAKSAGLVAHNSFLHAFAELGFFGGIFFVGAFAYSIESLHRRGRRRVILDPELRRLQPYLLGLLSGYSVGMMSLTLCYIIPTYTLLGAANVFLRLAETSPPLPPARFDARLLVRLAGIGVGVMIVLYVFVRFFRVAG
jgi:O-antigen ligase